MKRFLSEIGVRRDVNWRVKDSPLLLRLLLFNNSIIICRERERERVFHLVKGKICNIRLSVNKIVPRTKKKSASTQFTLLTKNHIISSLSKKKKNLCSNRLNFLGGNMCDYQCYRLIPMMKY